MDQSFVLTRPTSSRGCHGVLNWRETFDFVDPNGRVQQGDGADVAGGRHVQDVLLRVPALADAVLRVRRPADRRRLGHPLADGPLRLGARPPQNVQRPQMRSAALSFSLYLSICRFFLLLAVASFPCSRFFRTFVFFMNVICTQFPRSRLDVVEEKKGKPIDRSVPLTSTFGSAVPSRFLVSNPHAAPPPSFALTFALRGLWIDPRPFWNVHLFGRSLETKESNRLGMGKRDAGFILTFLFSLSKKIPSLLRRFLFVCSSHTARNQVKRTRLIVDNNSVKETTEPAFCNQKVFTSSFTEYSEGVPS